MLCLSRKPGESIRVETSPGVFITFLIMELDRGKARIGIDAPRDMAIVRSELPPKPTGNNGKV
jgi:carbon storage regulator CsrA